jgi:hypothetical protein
VPATSWFDKLTMRLLVGLPKTIAAPAKKFQIPVVAQYLQLLPDLGSDIIVVRIDRAEALLECVDL